MSNSLVMLVTSFFGGGIMNRRAFLQAFIKGAVAAPLFPIAALAAPTRTILVQESPIAGFQYYNGHEMFPELWVDTPLLLVREQDNKYDEHTVVVHFKQYKLGFIPKAENTAVAQMLDRGEQLSAKVVHLEMTKNPWERVRFQVMLNG